MAHGDLSTIADLKTADGTSQGQEVCLTEEYYADFNTTVLEVPRYGWKMKELVNGEATIEYQRHNLKLLMCLTVDARYLKKEA